MTDDDHPQTQPAHTGRPSDAAQRRADLAVASRIVASRIAVLNITLSRKMEASRSVARTGVCGRDDKRQRPDELPHFVPIEDDEDGRRQLRQEVS